MSGIFLRNILETCKRRSTLIERILYQALLLQFHYIPLSKCAFLTCLLQLSIQCTFTFCSIAMNSNLHVWQIVTAVIAFLSLSFSIFISLEKEGRVRGMKERERQECSDDGRWREMRDGCNFYGTLYTATRLEVSSCVNKTHKCIRGVFSLEAQQHFAKREHRLQSLFSSCFFSFYLCSSLFHS